MAKVIMNVCDVAPCTFMADREFKLNGKTIHVCGEGCFTRLWSREYRNWKTKRYHLNANFATNEPNIGMNQLQTQEGLLGVNPLIPA